MKHRKLRNINKVEKQYTLIEAMKYSGGIIDSTNGIGKRFIGSKLDYVYCTRIMITDQLTELYYYDYPTHNIPITMELLEDNYSFPDKYEENNGENKYGYR